MRGSYALTRSGCTVPKPSTLGEREQAFQELQPLRTEPSDNPKAQKYSKATPVLAHVVVSFIIHQTWGFGV